MKGVGKGGRGKGERKGRGEGKRKKCPSIDYCLRPLCSPVANFVQGLSAKVAPLSQKHKNEVFHSRQCIWLMLEQVYSCLYILLTHRPANTNCSWCKRVGNLLCSSMELSTYTDLRVSSLTVGCDVCQTLKSSLVSSSKLAHLRTVYFAL